MEAIRTPRLWFRWADRKLLVTFEGFLIILFATFMITLIEVAIKAYLDLGGLNLAIGWVMTFLGIAWLVSIRRMYVAAGVGAGLAFLNDTDVSQGSVRGLSLYLQYGACGILLWGGAFSAVLAIVPLYGKYPFWIMGVAYGLLLALLLGIVYNRISTELQVKGLYVVIALLVTVSAWKAMVPEETAGKVDKAYEDGKTLAVDVGHNVANALRSAGPVTLPSIDMPEHERSQTSAGSWTIQLGPEWSEAQLLPQGRNYCWEMATPEGTYEKQFRDKGDPGWTDAKDWTSSTADYVRFRGEGTLKIWGQGSPCT